MENRAENAGEPVNISKRNPFFGVELKDIIVQICLLIAVFAVYVYFCAPTIILSSEFIAGWPMNGDSLSLANQADYRSASSSMTTPLWFILARIMRHIPFGEYAYRLHIMSAFFGALSVLLLFKIISGYKHNRYPEERNKSGGWFLTTIFPALAVALIFAFSYPFWLLSEYGSPDTLQMMMFLLVIYLLLTTFRARVFRYFYYCTIALALGVAVYPVLAGISPVIMAVIILKTLQIKGSRHVFILLAIYLCGFLIHLYHPVLFILQEKGEFPQYENFFKAFFEVILRQFRFLKWLIGTRTLLWLPISVLPMLVFIKWRDTGTLKTASHILRISLMVLCLLIGIFLMLNGDRRFIDPARIDLMMYSSANPFPFVLISLWLGYLTGYLFLVSAGTKASGSREFRLKNQLAQNKVRLVAISALVIFFTAVAGANFYLNSAPAVSSYELSNAFFSTSEDSGEVKKIDPGMDFKLRMCGCSLRDFRIHEQVGRRLLESIREFKYEPDSASVKTNAIITNSSSFAVLLEYMRIGANIGYDYVVYIKPFREEEWYYNTMLKYAFKIDPGASWDLGKYSYTDAMAESVMYYNTAIVCAFSIDELTKSVFEKQFKLRYGLWTSLMIAETRTGMSLAENSKMEFGTEDIAWFSAKDIDSFSDLLFYFDYSKRTNKADDLIIFMLKTNPDDPSFIHAVNERLNLYTRIGKIKEAQELVRRAIKIKKQFEYLLYILDGWTYYYSRPRDIDKAIDSFKESMRIQPTYLACDALVVALDENKNYEEAYKYAQQAKGLLGENAGAQAQSRAMDMLGWMAFKMWQEGSSEKMEEAIENLSEAVNLDENNVYAMIHYGAVMYASDDSAKREEGVALIKRAKEKSPSLAREADEITREIDSKRKP